MPWDSSNFLNCSSFHSSFSAGSSNATLSPRLNTLSMNISALLNNLIEFFCFFFSFSRYAGPWMDLFKCCNGEWCVQTTETHVSAPGKCSTCPSACSSCEASQRSIVERFNRMQLIPHMSDTWPKIESSEQANSNKTFCPGRRFNLLYRDLILAVSKNCLSKRTVLPTAAGGMPALNGKSSGWIVDSSTSAFTGTSADLSSTEVGPVSGAACCLEQLEPSAGGSGGLSTFAAFSALTNLSNLALHLLLCLPFSSEHALQSGLAPKRIMRSRVMYSAWKRNIFWKALSQVWFTEVC